MMNWKEFFKLTVLIDGPQGKRPYFNSNLNINENIEMSDLLLSRFDKWQLTPSESKRLSLDFRKILHCHKYFNSKEFDRIFNNFIQRLSQEKNSEFKFYTQGGGIYLFLAMMKHQGPEFMGKSIICETNEIPIPVVRIPIVKQNSIRLTYNPRSYNYLGRFPSLWARPEIIQLFDKELIKQNIAS